MKDWKFQPANDPETLSLLKQSYLKRAKALAPFLAKSQKYVDEFINIFLQITKETYRANGWLDNGYAKHVPVRVAVKNLLDKTGESVLIDRYVSTLALFEDYARCRELISTMAAEQKKRKISGSEAKALQEATLMVEELSLELTNRMFL